MGNWVKDLVKCVFFAPKILSSSSGAGGGSIVREKYTELGRSVDALLSSYHYEYMHVEQLEAYERRRIDKAVNVYEYDQAIDTVRDLENRIALIRGDYAYALKNLNVTVSPPSDAKENAQAVNAAVNATHNHQLKAFQELSQELMDQTREAFVKVSPGALKNVYSDTCETMYVSSFRQMPWGPTWQFVQDTLAHSSHDGTSGLAKVDVPITIFVMDSVGKALQHPDWKYKDQVKILNFAFASTPFRFQLQEIKRIVSNEFVRQDLGSYARMKAHYRRGRYDHLNLFFISRLPDDVLFDPATDQAPKRLGASSLPVMPHYQSPMMLALDGVVMVQDMLPGVRAEDGAADLSPLPKGMFLVHQVGHWLGLMHTFSDYTHDYNNSNNDDDGGKRGPSNYTCDYNDGVADTPNQLGPTHGRYETQCDRLGRTAWESCDGAGGSRQDLHNYMDYTDERCMRHFTRGQIFRMASVWKYCREGR